MKKRSTKKKLREREEKIKYIRELLEKLRVELVIRKA